MWSNTVVIPALGDRRITVGSHLVLRKGLQTCWSYISRFYLNNSTIIRFKGSKIRKSLNTPARQLFKVKEGNFGLVWF